MSITKWFRCLCAAAFVLSATPVLGTLAYAQAIPGYPNSINDNDPREIAMLPRYCIHTHSFNNVPGASNAENVRYVATLGEGFRSMHHYCWGLMKTNRALLLARDPTIRQYYLQDSLGEFDYVIANSPKEFVMLPEIHTKKGENLLRLGRSVEGFKELQTAIDLKPDYWPPYVAMSDHYKNLGDIKKARESLEKGLETSPGVKALTTRLSELDAIKSKRK